MSAAGAVWRMLRGVARLAVGRRGGAEALDGSAVQAWTGLAMLAAVNLGAEILAASRGDNDHYRPPADSALFWLALALGYTAAWLAAARAVARRCGQGARWMHYLAAWSWLQAWLLLLTFAVLVESLAGMPFRALQLGVTAYACWLGWFIARVVLGVGPWVAVGLVGLEIAIIATALVVTEIALSPFWG